MILKLPLRGCRYLVIGILFLGCAQYQKIFTNQHTSPSFASYSKYEVSDYEEHFNGLALSYLASPDIRSVPLRSQDQKYLTGIFQKIVLNNELLFTKKLVPKFHVIKNDIPFYFSFPGGHFFFSLGLIKKYIKSEDLLVAILAYEIVKMQRSIYRKKIVVPIGYLSTEQMISLAKIPLETKIKLDKWAFYAMKRAGYDGFTLLNWLQIQNKNTLDFTLQSGDSQSTLREEYMFKTFIISEGIAVADPKKFESNSSADFYKLTEHLQKL